MKLTELITCVWPKCSNLKITFPCNDNTIKNVTLLGIYNLSTKVESDNMPQVLAVCLCGLSFIFDRTYLAQDWEMILLRLYLYLHFNLVANLTGLYFWGGRYFEELIRVEILQAFVFLLKFLFVTPTAACSPVPPTLPPYFNIVTVLWSSALRESERAGEGRRLQDRERMSEWARSGESFREREKAGGSLGSGKNMRESGGERERIHRKFSQNTFSGAQ